PPGGPGGPPPGGPGGPPPGGPGGPPPGGPGGPPPGGPGGPPPGGPGDPPPGGPGDDSMSREDVIAAVGPQCAQYVPSEPPSDASAFLASVPDSCKSAFAQLFSE
ncbi:MAG: hypothetical protein P8R01_06900, partial [Gammaproteobacteria bacterium]|nr:hypothetical protein [Gammaproteobacteria bacterium]